MDFGDIIEFLTTGLTGKILSAVLVLLLGVFIIRIVMQQVQKALGKTHLEKAAHGMILSLSRTVLYVLVGLSVISSLGIEVTGVVALASVATLAISLAMQNMLTNVIGGFTLLYNHPFRSGDFVEIAGQSGKVEEINMAYTRLSTPDNKQISLPNSAVVTAQIVNYSATGTRRIEIPVSASYDAPTQKVLDALLQAGTVDKVMPDPAPFSAISSYGDSAIHYILRLWASSDDYWDVYYLVNKRIKDVFDEQDIEMTYPHLNVHLDKPAN